MSHPAGANRSRRSVVLRIVLAGIVMLLVLTGVLSMNPSPGTRWSLGWAPLREWNIGSSTVAHFQPGGSLAAMGTFHPGVERGLQSAGTVVGNPL